MKSDATINQQLNAVLSEALTGINQYFLHARMLGNWGLKGLEKHEYEASLRAMKHADRLMQRILLLEGLPNVQGLGKLLVGEDVQEILKYDLAAEMRYRDALVAAIAHCEQQGDYVSRHHLEEFQEDSEEAIDWLETQIQLLERIGLENYQQSAL